MKTRMMLVMSALLMALTVSAASKVTETRKLSGFCEIEINGSPKVIYTQGKTFSVRLTGEQSDIDNIETTVSGQTLTVRNKGKYGIINFSLRNRGEVVVYVTSPDLISVRLNGSGDFISNQRIDTDNMRLVLRGSGDVKVKDLICDDCHVELVGSGDVDVDRLESRRVDASLVGSGDVDLKLHRVDITKLSLKGSGDIDVEFRDGCGSVENELRGSGVIKLKGTVRQIKKQKSGSGDIDIDKLTIQK